MIQLKNPNKMKKKLLGRFRPDSLRPIKRWADLTTEEQTYLSQEYLALTMLDFNISMPKSDGTAVMTLSLKDFQDALLLRDSKHANVTIDNDNPILNQPIPVQFGAFIEHVVAAMSKDGLLNRLLSNKMQRIRLYHVLVKEKDNIVLDAIREQAEMDYEDFMKANEDKLKTDEDKLRLMEFILTTAKT